MSEQQGQPGGQQPRFMPPQLDETDVDEHWSPPTADEPDDGRGLPGPAKAAIVVLALAVVIGGVWALGGFKPRTDVSIPVQPGQQVTTGPYEFVFTDATVQKVKDYDDTIEWRLIVRGTGRTTGEQSISPSTINAMFVAKDPLTVETPEPDTDTIGVGRDGPANFTPGLPPVPYQIEFTFTERYEPSADVQFGVADLEYGNNLILDTGEKIWHNARDVYIYRLPVTVLPPDLD